MGMFRILSPGVSITVTEKTAPRRQEGMSDCTQACTKGAGPLNIKDQVSG